MLKLIIADDERIIRETISTIIDWKQYDIELVGLCKNGLEAYDMILDENMEITLSLKNGENGQSIYECPEWTVWS